LLIPFHFTQAAPVEERSSAVFPSRCWVLSVTMVDSIWCRHRRGALCLIFQFIDLLNIVERGLNHDIILLFCSAGALACPDLTVLLSLRRFGPAFLPQSSCPRLRAQNQPRNVPIT
jgi:hypothetical protein